MSNEVFGPNGENPLEHGSVVFSIKAERKTFGSIEDRVAVQIAIGNYIRARDRFEEVSQDFNESCCRLRQILPRECRLMSQVQFANYLVTCDKDGNFEVEQIETI